MGACTVLLAVAQRTASIRTPLPTQPHCKEPVAAEYGFLRSDLVLFTFLHLAADEPLTHALAGAGTTAVAHETVHGLAFQQLSTALS